MAAAAAMLEIQSVTCYQHRTAAVVAMALQHDTDSEVVAVTTESSSTEMMEGEAVAARCSEIPASTLK